jgi:hypothetical protein
MKLIKYFILLYTLPMVLIIAACTKEDSYKDFEKGGEIKYPGRVDSVIARPGNGRIQLSLVMGNDPLVTRIKVYWNNRQDSTETEVTTTNGRDTVNMLLPLPQGNYNFEIYTFDKDGNRSIVKNKAGTIYGSNYISSLENRALKTIGFTPANSLLLTFGEPATGEIGVQINYTNGAGQAKTANILPTTTTFEIADFKDESITYKSLFKPDSLAYESFSPTVTGSVTIPVFEKPLDKSKFVAMLLPGDVDEGGYGWLLKYLWDENYNPPGFATRSTIPAPFTFDTGVSTKLSRFKMWQANDRLYQKESAKTFEVWGSNSPNPNGSWDSWTKLLTCESIKPSGSPVGTNTAEDIAYAKAGEDFTFPATVAKYRYLRFKMLTNWGGGGFMTMEELTFWTKDR